ncbi:hypothetical protein QYM36_005188, partial [Artemia franciscana]
MTVFASGIDAANQNDDEILCPVEKQKSVSMLLGLLKEVFGNQKKVPGRKDNVKEICDRILVLHQNAIEENSELLRKENHHLQTIVKLQEHIGDLNKTPISMFGVAQPTVTLSRSFASAVRGQNVYSVILEPVEYDKNSDKRLGRNDLQKLTKSFYQAIDKDSKNFAVKKAVPAKNGKIIFELGSESDSEEAISAFNKKIEVTKYKAVQVKKKIPRIIVYDVKECVDADSFRTEFLRSNDNVKDMVDHGDLLKVVTVLWKDRNRANVVLEVSPKLRKFILLNGHVKLGFLLKRCEDYVFLIKCSNRCLYGHRPAEWPPVAVWIATLKKKPILRKIKSAQRISMLTISKSFRGAQSEVITAISGVLPIHIRAYELTAL